MPGGAAGEHDGRESADRARSNGIMVRAAKDTRRFRRHLRGCSTAGIERSIPVVQALLRAAALAQGTIRVTLTRREQDRKWLNPCGTRNGNTDGKLKFDLGRAGCFFSRMERYSNAIA